MKGLLISILFIISNSVFAQLGGELGILDVTANGGINPQTGVAWEEGDAYRLVFVSSTMRDANSIDIADYNVHVQSAANAAGLGSVSWYAIGSTSTVNARDNTLTQSTDTDGAFFLMNGSEVVADRITDLWDGNISTQIDLNENGNLRPNDTPIWTQWTGVWTGTKDNGTANGGSYLGASTVTLGVARAELKFWEKRSNHSDNSVNLPFYGISEVLNVQTILPIDLLNFDATQIDGRRVKLNWQTASEENNDYFTIERSSNGIDWEEREKISGAGTSSSTINYEMIDTSPSAGISYYRLKQTDFDGQFSYSKKITVSFNLNNAVVIYPNPVIDVITIIGKEYDLQNIKIFNAYAQDVTDLTQLERLGTEKVSIEVSRLNEGIYWIKVKNVTKKIYKMSTF